MPQVIASIRHRCLLLPAVLLLLAGSAAADIWYFDGDGDGYGQTDVWIDEATSPGPDWVLQDGDCEDNDDTVYPGAPELCDGKDNDCDTVIDNDCWPLWYRDGDGDGYGLDYDTVYAATQPGGYAALPGDCNDNNDQMNPGETEVCDGIDNNCDNQIDEGLELLWYRDADGDNFGDPDVTTFNCQPLAGWVLGPDTDCDDNRATVHPGALELPDGLDNDCDGEIDEGWITWYYDGDDDGWGDFFQTVVDTLAPAGYVDQPGDCEDDNPQIHPDAVELCNGIDDDCDGDIDEDCVFRWYRDADEDGYGDENDYLDSETQPAGYVLEGADCDDTEPTVYPLACELCDGLDNDCDGLVDNFCGQVWYRDQDQDGYGDENDTACGADQPNGYVDLAGDCDDGNPDTYPGAPELCDDQDNDCDGEIDEDALLVWYQDLDEDGYGTAADSLYACEWSPGWAPVLGDCDDTDPMIQPGIWEECNGVDDNCDGLVDEAPANGEELFFLYRDADDDGYGGEEWGFCIEPLPVPEGFSELGGDCDDTDPAIHPGAEEPCDGIDNNCDGHIDEGVGVWWYPDGDQDGYGHSQSQYNQFLCPGEDPLYPEYFVTNDLDCDDSDPNIHPGVLDLNDWIDNDCDGEIDEDAGTTAIASIQDVGNDQGRYVRVRWTRHLMDQPGAPEAVSLYTLYRRIDAWKSAGEAVEPAVLRNAPPGDWDWVATVPATGDSLYSLVAHTLCDSTDAGICWSVFFVRTHTPDPFVFYDSPVDSSYSIDNLFPDVPQDLSANYTPDQVTLQWAPSTAPDFRNYRVYRGEGEFPLDALSLVQETVQPAWTDPISQGYDLEYRVTTVDQSGNESAAAAPLSTTGAGGPPQAWALGAPVPNPFNPLTTFAFVVPGDGGTVRLEVFDIAGRRVKTLVREHRAGGTYEAVWRGDDDTGRLVPAGAYFCRLQGDGFHATRRMMLVK